jgi:biopolymer transport protein ExbD
MVQPTPCPLIGRCGDAWKGMVTVVVLWLFAFPEDANSQAARKKPQVSAPATVTAPAEKPRTYEFRIRIDADKTASIELMTGYEFDELGPADIHKALSEFHSIRNPEPIVTIAADDSLDLRTVILVVRAARISVGTKVKIDIPESIFTDVEVQADPKFLKKVEVRPNPLMLLAALGKGNAVTLNNERYGTLQDLSSLTNKLKEIFQLRSDNLVLREGSLEVEKTVYMKLDQTAKFSDLGVLARAIFESGADPVILQVEDEMTFPDPPPPRPRKNNK